MINSEELYWEIFNYIKDRRTLIAGGTDPTIVDDSITSTIDSQLKIFSTSESAKTEDLFNLTIDRSSFNSSDYLRLKNFLIDWYSAHKTIVSQQRDITDVYSLTEENLEELIRSFGFNYLPDYLNLSEKQIVFLNLVNLYKIKGSPESISKLLSFFGIYTKIHEFYLTKHPVDNRLEFVGYDVDNSDRTKGIYYDYDVIVNADPHWFHRDPSTILNLLDENKISLPTKTRYFSINPGSYIDEIKSIMMLISTKIYIDYKWWEDSGNLPPEDVDRLIELTDYSTSDLLTFFELYIAFIYLFNKEYPISIDSTASSEALVLSYNKEGYYTDSTSFDSTSVPDMPIIGEYDGYKDIYDFFVEMSNPDIGPSGITRETKETLHNVYLNHFSRSLSEMDYLSKIMDSTSNLLEEINPELKTWIDSQEVDGPQEKALIRMAKALNEFIQAFIVFDLELSIVDISFQNIDYYIFSNSDPNILKSINFFKPYRSKLIDLKEVISDDKLGNSIRFSDALGDLTIISTFVEMPMSDAYPCCDSTSLICYDSTSYPEDSTSFDTYASRNTYDCDGYFDRGIVWDELTLISIGDKFEDDYSGLDSTSTILNYSIRNSRSGGFDGTAFIDVEIGSPIDSGILLDYFDNEVDSMISDSTSSMVPYRYSLQQSGFPETFDIGNEFDYNVAGVDICQIYIRELETEDILTNLTSAYLFDSNVLDSHGINDLTNVGVPYSTGKIGNALSFDGTAKKVSINGNPFSNSQGSVSCWFKLNSAANLVNYTIFSYGGGVAAIAGNLQLLAGGDGTNFNLSIVQRSDGGGLPDICRTGFIFNPGSWYFIVLSSDSSEWTMNINVVNYPLSVYLGVNNGDWFEDTVVSPITKTVIGAQYINNSYSEYFDGLIDQFLVHDVKLSTTQITKMWNSGNGLDYNNF